MRAFPKIIGVFLNLAAASTALISAAVAVELPSPPRTHVLDEPGILSPSVRSSLQTLLAEQDRLTSEQVVLAIFNSLQDQDPVDWTNRIFAKWGIGKKGKDNGVLLALYWKEHQTRIEVGYGLEPLLTDAKSKRVLEEFLIPGLKAGENDEALSLAVLEILRIIESPLVESGKAAQILRQGGLRGELQPISERGPPRGWVVWVVLGLILAAIALNILTSAEAHYTGEGWYRPRPRIWRRPSHTIWGGGGWGGGGGSGGFRSGGGLSGGGGASGQW